MIFCMGYSGSFLTFSPKSSKIEVFMRVVER
jgi:hypothetical protein